MTATPLLDRFTTPRGAALLILGVSIAAIGGAFWYQSLGFLPCELCYKERIPYYAAFALAPLAYGGAATGRMGAARAALLLLALLFAADAALSFYHSGVEWKIFKGPDDCSGPLTRAVSVDDFMKQLQSARVVRCDKPSLWILGLTLANWNVLMTSALAWAAGKAAARRPTSGAA